MQRTVDVQRTSIVGAAGSRELNFPAESWILVPTLDGLVGASTESGSALGCRQRSWDERGAILQLLGSRPVAYYPALAAIGGGVTAGVFLAQLLYRHDKGADPDGWIYKPRAEWQAETGLTRTEQETARRRLWERGILEEKLAGLPTRLFYRLDADRVIEMLATGASADAKRPWASGPGSVRGRRNR